MIQTEQVIQEVKKMIKGKDTSICKVFAAMLAGGHILIDDVPGVGKTTLAVAFSQAMQLEITECSLHRMFFRQIFLAFPCIRRKQDSLCIIRGR